MDIAQPFGRICDVGAKWGDHRRHLVAHIALFLSRPNRDRCHRGQRLLRKIILREQIFAHRPADDSQEHIIDLAARGKHPDRLDIGQCDAASLNHSIGRYNCVKAAARRDHFAADVEILGGNSANSPSKPGDCAGESFDLFGRVDDCIEPALGQKRQWVWHFLGLPAVRLIRRGGVCLEGMQSVEQVNPAHPVDRRMMDLGDHSKAARGNPRNIVEPLNNGEFPRWATKIEWSCEDSCGLNAQLPPITRPGQGDMTNMIFQIEFSVLDPIGVVQIERNSDQTLAHGLGQLDPAFEMPQNVFEPHKAARRRFRVVNQQ